MLLPNKKLLAPLLATGLAILVVGAATLGAGKEKPTPPDSQKLIVHEWGTFLSVQGSDGVTLGGMVDSDETLPPFVESRSISTWQRSMLRSKMETPVTYFYTDRPRDVQVQVRMPKGVLTHWFPAVCRFGPKPAGKSSPAPTNSYLDWCTVRLIPPGSPPVAGSPAAAIPKIGSEQTWRFARETDAALVRVQTWNQKGDPEYQYEKFLFYRGLGTFQLPLEIRSQENGRNGGLFLALKNTSDQPLRGLYAVRVEKGAIQFAALADLQGKANREVAPGSLFSSSLPLDEGVPRVKSAVAAGLVSAGLYSKEAQAMVNTWEKSYFRTEGLRMLYVLPRETVDSVIPIQIKPAPDHLVRVMVGRVEVLTPAAERRIAEAVARLGAPDPVVRKAAEAELAGLGRLREPVLRRLVALSSVPEVRAQAEALILAAAAGK